jgi:hypothetical protein
MDFELLLNKSKIKKNKDPTHYNTRLKKVIDIIQSLNVNNPTDNVNFNTNIIPKFKQFIHLYTELKQTLSIEKEKHQFINTIIEDILNKAINEIELVDKTTKNSNIKQITECIVNQKNNKMIKFNVKK